MRCRLCWLPLLIVLASDPASAQQCRLLDLSFAPAAPTQAGRTSLPQIVAWLEDSAGTFVSTVYITHATGTFGIGNRPGRFDFNSGRRWPYGRRTTTFPVWSHRHGLSWPELQFQDGLDSNLSHSMGQSPRDTYFCRPIQGTELDALSCPSELSFVDHGRFSEKMSLYPMRDDVRRVGGDSADVDMYSMLNPFDAVSQPTPQFGVDAAYTYEIPFDVPSGSYTLMVEVAKEIDMNGTYNPTIYPPPRVAFDTYGEPYRGQPSVIYRLPIVLGNDQTVAMTEDYIGYGDPDGVTGDIRAPDATISTDVGTGSGRLALLSNGGQTYRVRVVSRHEDDRIAPTVPTQVGVANVTSSRATIELVAPGDDGSIGTVRGYEVRYRIGEPITESNFDTATPIVIDTALVTGGEIQTIELRNLLPDTEYSIGIRAFDNCRNVSPLVVLPVTTDPRVAGEVDACFIATAAYGSIMARDVGLLRHFRDAMLRHSPLGELAIAAYYTFGPPAAGAIGESDLLRETARDLLAPIVARVRGD